MNNKENKSSMGSGAASGGIGFCGLLTIVFIVLKLTKVISWSWFWVLSPMIFSVGFAVLLIVVLLLILGILTYIKHKL